LTPGVTGRKNSIGTAARHPVADHPKVAVVTVPLAFAREKPSTIIVWVPVGFAFTAKTGRFAPIWTP
jgi:hypothetical protein